jgi:hypothetical protein
MKKKKKKRVLSKLVYINFASLFIAESAIDYVIVLK